jgi:uncharacterized protein YkwD
MVMGIQAAVYAAPPAAEPITAAEPTITAEVTADEKTSTLTPPCEIGFDFRALEAAGFAYEDIQSVFEQEVIRIVNEIRAEYGLQALAFHPELANVARLRTEEKVYHNVRGHLSPATGLEHTEHARAMGLNLAFAGENAVRGPRTPQAVVDAWLDSTVHRQFILSGHRTSPFHDLGHIGVGFSFDERRTAWTLWQTCNRPA